MDDKKEKTVQPEITKLTDAQKELMEQRKREWEVVSQDCSPADFGTAETAIARLYEILGKARPKFIRVSSPFGAQIAINAFTAIFLPEQAKNDKPDQNADLALKFTNLKANVLMDVMGSIEREKITKGKGIQGEMTELLERKKKIQFVNTNLWGQHDAYWIAFYKFCEEIGVVYEAKDAEILELWTVLCKSIMWWWAFDDYCFISNRPTEIHFNERGFLHNKIGPAIAFRDGYKMYGVNGVRIPDWVIETPARITPTLIDNEENAEVRRVMFEQYEELHGKGSYMKDGGAVLLDEDKEWEAALFRKEMKDDEPVLMVRCKNSTAEPIGYEGSTEDNRYYKIYWLRVPERGGENWSFGDGQPEIKTARQALAWTCGKLEKDYQPFIQT